MTIIVNNKSFKTKKALKEYVDNLLEANINSHLYSGGDFYFLKDLMKRHPRYKVKFKSGCKAFIIRRMSRKHTALRFIDEKGGEYSISYNKCVTGLDSSLQQDRLKAMRNAIKDQTMAFYRENFTEESCCIICEERLFAGFIHVDHIVKFKDIASEFLSLRLEHPIEFDNKHDNKGVIFYWRDRGYQKEWEQFHRDRAKLRLLCQSCNLKNK